MEDIMIRVLVDSAADYTAAELAEKGLLMVPLTITVGENQSYKDEIELPRSEVYRLLLEGKETVKTSQPSPQEFLEVFEQVKEAGDEVIVITLSSSLSGTCQSARLARELVDYKGKIHIIDSLSATVAVKILADHALKLAAEGHPAEEITEILEEMKGRLRITAVVDTLKYLYLGGRVSKTTAAVADTVNIKPGITINTEGFVEVGSKYLGIARGVKDLVKRAKNGNIDTDFPMYLIYSHNSANAEKLKKGLEDAGVRVDAMHELGATLGVHIGPGAFGTIYLERK